MPLLSTTLLALALGSPTGPSPAFTAFQRHYFPHLDGRAAPATLAEVPALEAEVAALEAQAVEAAGAGRTLPGFTADETSRLPLYDALLTLNDLTLVSQGRLTLAQLQAARPLGTPGAGQAELLAARADHAASVLAGDGLRLRPADHRIDSWHQGALVSAASLRHEDLGGLLQGLVEVIPTRVTFNLWTAMLVFRNVPATDPLFDEVAGFATQYVDAVQAGHDPCIRQPADCRSGSDAPTNLPASLVVLGDTLLRSAEARLASSPDQANRLAQDARGTYAELTTKANAPLTAQWSDRDTVAPRLARAAQVLKGQAPGGSFWDTDVAARPYECSSCHGRSLAGVDHPVH